ncbi:MAG: hypothetical protein HQM12_03160 [SAR324 cluster bacterium]|nr:hypothetical protein [SAR324 cluster bacterium]
MKYSSINTVDSLFNYDLPPSELLCDVLLARGFFVELFDNQIILSDNALLKPSSFQRLFDTKIHDALSLERLLRFSDLGELHGHNLIVLRPPITKNKVRLLFESRHVGGEVCYRLHSKCWNNFKKYQHGFKIPTSVLDTHVAILVKAFSACGCNTWLSCEGYQNNAYIYFIGPYHGLWAQMIFKKISSSYKLENHWKFSTESLHVEPCEPESRSSHNLNIEGVWTELITIGVAIYKNRIELRDLKQRIIASPEAYGFYPKD